VAANLILKEALWYRNRITRKELSQKNRNLKVPVIFDC